MEISEFEKTAFTAGMYCEFKGNEFEIISVDFEENLIAIDQFGDEELMWKRCENITLIEKINR